MVPNFLFLCFALSLLSHIQFSISQNTINFTSFNASDSPWRPNQNRILLSPNSNFSAGFFRISLDRYTFSVWFTNVPLHADPVVWSANFSSPVTGSASLVINSKGELLLDDILSVNASSTSNSTSSVLILSDQGNLIFGDWSSFGSPTNTILPNQNITEIALHSENGLFRFVKSKDLILYSASLSLNYSLANYYNTPSPLVIMDDLGKMTMVSGSFLTSDYGDNRLRKMVLGNDGNLKIYSFYPEQKTPWVEVWLAIWQPCKIRGKCGPNAICLPSTGINDSTSCVCPPGFKQNQGGPQQGCVRKIKPTSNIKFLKLDYVNYTSTNMIGIDARNFTICESNCSANSQCLGFGYKYDGSGFCSLVLGEQLLYGYWSPGTEASLFLKVDKSETEASNFTGMTQVLQTSCPVRISLPLPPKDSNSTTRNIAVICTLFAAELISGIAFFWSFLKRYIKYRDMATTLGLEFLPAGGPKRFSHAELKTATKDFSNLIGRGGFGEVYKGELPDHRVVAVKCLKNVAGGDAEFWAEVTIIARMHHLNLVRLWGFCAEKGQRILVYEYIPGGSLDKYLFRRPRAGSKNGELSPDSDPKHDPKTEQKPILDWNIRYRIALGVARSIAYLHEECLEWVLHCDIKPENILLGEDFCPKISDFGLAKLRKKEDMVTMSRRRGTPGYMAPEWITTDPITSKADVYSFGMVLLELVSGVRNFEIQGSFLNSEEWYFPGWAFDKMFKEMRPEDILDREIKQLYDSRAHFDMINRMVKTAMWCLQDRPEMRPTMGKVAKMLEGTVEIIEPKKPTVFFLGDE